ncbi:NAD-dependent aldehyde dehydrogenase [Gongronella butleri]|nr:NAD-dependent aldehyde dehydrogenase [Gongronella butleri]
MTLSLSRLWPSWQKKALLGAFSGGTLRDGGRGATGRSLVNPMTAQEVVQVLDTTTGDVDAAVDAASVAQGVWGSVSGIVRRDALLKLSDAIMAHRDALAAMETLQTGKPLGDAVLEMDEVSHALRHFAGYADKPLAVSLAEHGTEGGNVGMHMTTHREPLGVCGLITSYNYPLMLTGWKLAPALAAGNAVIIKPAPQTPLTSLALAELAAKVLPKDLVQVLPGGVDTGKAIVARVDKTSFTGSTPGGQAIMRQAADTLQPLTLECGGKNSVIVAKDADLPRAVEFIAQGAFSNAGQNCCAASRVLVHADVHDQFVNLLENETRKWKPYMDASNASADSAQRFYGPLIDKQQLTRVQRYIDPTRAAFQAPAVEENTGFYATPTVYTQVDDHDALAQEEIFGPVLSVLRPFTSTEEAIVRANGTPFGLAAGVFAGNYSTAHHIASKLQTGIVWINTYNYLPASFPFGGRKLSGFGKDLGANALAEFTFTKSILHGL